jgi:hypothetical protein
MVPVFALALLSAAFSPLNPVPAASPAAPPAPAAAYAGGDSYFYCWASVKDASAYYISGVLNAYTFDSENHLTAIAMDSSFRSYIEDKYSADIEASTCMRSDTEDEADSKWSAARREHKGIEGTVVDVDGWGFSSDN